MPYFLPQQHSTAALNANTDHHLPDISRYLKGIKFMRLQPSDVSSKRHRSCVPAAGTDNLQRAALHSWGNKRSVTFGEGWCVTSCCYLNNIDKMLSLWLAVSLLGLMTCRLWWGGGGGRSNSRSDMVKQWHVMRGETLPNTVYIYLYIKLLLQHQRKGKTAANKTTYTFPPF